MPHSFLLPNPYDGETLLSQCPFLSTDLNFTSSFKSISFTLIPNDLSLSLWISKPCLYYKMLSIYFGTHYFPIVFCVDWFFPIAEKLLWAHSLPSRTNDCTPGASYLFTTNQCSLHQLCQSESKTQEKKAIFICKRASSSFEDGATCI